MAGELPDGIDRRNIPVCCAGDEPRGVRQALEVILTTLVCLGNAIPWLFMAF